MTTTPLAVTFDLRSLLSEVAGRTSDPNPHELTASLLAAIPAESRDDALLQALYSFVYHTNAPVGGALLDQCVDGTSTPAVEQGAASPAVEQGAASPGVWYPSGSVRRMREHWQREIARRVSISPGDYKTVGKCTYDDLLAVAAERGRQAQRLVAAEAGYTALASLLVAHQVTLVEQLPPEVLRSHYAVHGGE